MRITGDHGVVYEVRLIRLNRQGYRADGEFFGAGSNYYSVAVANGDKPGVPTRASNQIQAMRIFAAKP